MQCLQLSVNASNILTLDAGWWEETMEDTALGNPLPCRLIHPPEPTMYDQVLRHLETISHEPRIPPKSQLNFGEIPLATIAVCLRWGTYFAVLADRTKPIWPQTGQEEISMIGDEEIARINSAQSRQLFFAMLKEQYGEVWLEQKRPDIMPNPARWLANQSI